MQQLHHDLCFYTELKIGAAKSETRSRRWRDKLQRGKRVTKLSPKFAMFKRKPLIGVPGVGPGSHAPHACILPLYYTPVSLTCPANYLFFPIVLMHLVQALTLFPDNNLTHCKLGYFLFLLVGLYLPRSFFLTTATIDFFPQSGQTRDMVFI